VVAGVAVAATDEADRLVVARLEREIRGQPKRACPKSETRKPEPQLERAAGSLRGLARLQAGSPRSSVFGTSTVPRPL
jgi:hypothetical protein